MQNGGKRKIVFALPWSFFISYNSLLDILLKHILFMSWKLHEINSRSLFLSVVFHFCSNFLCILFFIYVTVTMLFILLLSISVSVEYMFLVGRFITILVNRTSNFSELLFSFLPFVPLNFFHVIFPTKNSKYK